MSKTVFEGKCTKCGSTNLDYGLISPEDDIMVQPVECNDCHEEFQIYTGPTWYVL